MDFFEKVNKNERLSKKFENFEKNFDKSMFDTLAEILFKNGLLLRNEVSKVMTVFPDLNERFISACVQLKGNAEASIDAIIENRLPKEILALNIDGKHKEQVSLNVTAHNANVIEFERLKNAFLYDDEDEIRDNTAQKDILCLKNYLFLCFE